MESRVVVAGVNAMDLSRDDARADADVDARACVQTV